LDPSVNEIIYPFILDDATAADLDYDVTEVGDPTVKV